MKLKLPLLLVLVYAPVLWPQRAYKALAHTGCDTWQNLEGVRNLIGRLREPIGASGDPGRGGIAWIRHSRTSAEFINNSKSFVLQVLYLATDSIRDSTWPPSYWVEVGHTDTQDDSNPNNFTYFHGFYYAYRYNWGGTGIYEEVFVRNVVPGALGEDYRYQIKWDPSADTNGAYRIYITTANNVKHLVGTAWDNMTNAWHFVVAGEASYCDGNDGDNDRNWFDPTYTDSWFWSDDEGQVHWIVSPNTVENDFPIHLWILSGGDRACVHMNTTAGC